MRRTSVVQLIVAATLVLLGGLALAFAGEGVRLQVVQKASDEVQVSINGETQVVRLQGLADGEQKTFTAGEHTVAVKRAGDTLEVLLDGKEPGHGGGEGFLCVGQGGEGAHRVVKKVVVVDDDDSAAGEHGYRFKVSTEGEGEGGEEVVKVIQLGGDEEVALPAESGPERVTFRCPEDGTVLRIAKDKATRESYACPVCGRAMEKVKTPEVKILTLVTQGAKKEKKTD